ncbi:hypothetical protein HHK36_006894 [Tetracentron sinense]|uniref:F-box domain-containing protein n=1 Tax=Tetracentron sinense TaxID=13715 RepID=A0A835DL66_TETSI|nr:hypothetical protein HHK36_006894 [Tetracentron sinense]
MQLDGCNCIKIYGPNLKHFHFDGEFADVCFIDAPHLSYVSITLYGDVGDQHFGQGKVSNLVRVLGCLTALEKLVIGECFMEFLAMGILPKRLLVTYDRLKSISLFINFNDLNQSLAMLFLFQSSPNLQELKMLVSTSDSYILVANQVAATKYVVDFWKALGHLNCSMNHLRMVKIIMWGAKSELELIKFLLANSPVLEILSVNHITSEKVDESRVLKELVRFPRASTKAQIEYKIHQMSSLHKMETPHRRSSDIISNLPDQVIETILAYWPIQDAVQTSLLSNKWRYKWNLIPTLVFHEERTHFPPDTKAFASNKIVNFVDRVLLQHKGSIHKFELSTHSLQDYVIDSWLLFLSKNGVKELVLQFLSRDRYC